MEKISKNLDFLELAFREVWEAAGLHPEHAEIIARSVAMADRDGKHIQGLPVMEYLFYNLDTGNLDVEARPEIVAEGASWALVEGHRSTGHWAMTVATKAAIEKARANGVAVGMARNHGDTGYFHAYTSLALEQDMFAFGTNNTGPFVSPYGAMEHKLSGAPFTAVAPGGEEFPIVADMRTVTTGSYEANEAFQEGTKLHEPLLADPETGELTNDPAPYAKIVEGNYTRFCHISAPVISPDPRDCTLNIAMEMMAGFLVPGAAVTPEIRTTASGEKGPGRSGFILVIDPSHFGPIEDAKARSDRFVRAIKSARPLPGVEEVLLPGERAQRRANSVRYVELQRNHWDVFEEKARTYGVDLVKLEEECRAQSRQ